MTVEPTPTSADAAPREEAAQEYLTFRVGGERCALALSEALEIVEYRRLTRVPLAPAGVLGVFNLRGRVVPAADLARRIGLEAQPTPRRCLIVVQAPEEEDGAVIALLVDVVEDVVSLGRQAVQAAPSQGTPVRASALRGVAHERGLLHVLDLGQVLRFDVASPRSSLGTERA